MSSNLVIRNRRRSFPVDLRLLRRITRTLLQDLLFCDNFELSIWLVNSESMAELNATYLRHEGPTDVITFDYADDSQPGLLCGDIFICTAEAISQARRFRTTWESELTRYVVHGLLHLCGYDDTSAVARKRMKSAEARLLKALALKFNLRKLGGPRGRLKRSSPQNDVA